MVNMELRRAWRDSPPLMGISAILMVTLVGCVAGILLDSRVITGEPAWLKPAKFAFSIALFCGTIAWLFRYLTIWPRFRGAVGWALAASGGIEAAVIDLQAARGTTSHFNTATPFDAALFTLMGVTVGVLWLGSGAVLAMLFRQKFQSESWGWWLRLGMLITVVGSATGGMMLRMTPEQTRALHAYQAVRAIGGHTVGAPDGGAGMPGLHWSTQHGDLRIAHFFGLHGIQIIPLIGWLAGRRRRSPTEPSQTRLAFTVAASYAAWMGILLWQALRGQSVVHPDGAMLAVVGTWFAVSSAACLVGLRSRL